MSEQPKDLCDNCSHKHVCCIKRDLDTAVAKLNSFAYAGKTGGFYTTSTASAPDMIKCMYYKLEAPNA